MNIINLHGYYNLHSCTLNVEIIWMFFHLFLDNTSPPIPLWKYFKHT